MSKKSIAIVDRFPATLDGMKVAAAYRKDLTIIDVDFGAVQDKNGLTESLIDQQPDVILWDLEAGRKGMFGTLSMIREIRGRLNGVSILGYSQFKPSMVAGIFEKVGAYGYLQKTASAPDHLRTIDAVMSETRTGFICAANKDSKDAQNPYELFTPREFDIFVSLGQGSKRNDIAANMGITKETVQGFCIKMRNKLGLNGIYELRAAAHKCYLTSGEQRFESMH